MFNQLRRLALVLAVADALATQLALLAADWIRRLLPLGALLDAQHSYLNWIIHLQVAAIFPVVFLALHVYDVRRDTHPAGDPLNLARAVATAVFVFAGALYFSYRDVPRLLVIYFFFIELAALTAPRLLALLALRVLRLQGRALSRVMLVGAGDAAELLIQGLRARLGDSVEIVGCATDEAADAPGDLPVLGGLSDVPRLVREQRIDEVILALPSDKFDTAEQLAFALLDQPVRVRLVPDYLRLVVVQSSVEAVAGIPLIGLREPRLAGFTWALKRAFDVVTVGLLLLLCWPLMLAIAAAIKLDSPGPMIFKQKRVGENGRLFWMYKFRTMATNADMLQPDVALDEHGRQVYKRPDDRRITRIGRFLRRTSLDELPQFFNVLQGEMSLVGPRPELEFIVEKYEPWQRQRLAVLPGITGWWQVNGRSTLPMHLNTHLDLYYIRNYSFWLDLLILWKTAGEILRGRGAF